jgi:farnesyl diphosphate synthase
MNPNPMTSQLIEQYLQRHELFLERLVNDADIPSERIDSALHYSLFPGGKRIRPLLVYLAGTCVSLKLEILDIIAAAVELTHCYSLIHDDLPAMDNDDFRRGKPSCHKAFDEATAILVGDGMQALAIETLISLLPSFLNSKQVIHVAEALLKASGISGMVSGQSLDLIKLSHPNVSETELQQVHQLKTGQLISACVKMVLSASSDACENTQQALMKYAHHVGFVFQIQDDYLDRYAPKKSLGKGRSSDAANNKITFATLYSKLQLEQYITTHYQAAMNALVPFGDKALPLLALTRQLESRTPVAVL